jgi:hypothetical protein
MGWVLVIHDNDEMLDALGGAVESALSPGSVKTAHNIAEGRSLLADYGRVNCDLIITSLTARLDASHAPDPFRRELTGLDFIREVRGEASDLPPALLIATLIDSERASSVASVPNAKVLNVKQLFTSLEDDIRAAARGRLNARFRIDLDIFLRGEGHCRWTMRGTGGVEDAAVMDITGSELAELGDLSQPAGSGGADFLGRLGLSVYKLLMADSIKSGDLEVKLRDRAYGAGGLSTARIRFNVDKITHRIHLETLAKPASDGKPEFWMGKVPMFRKFGDRGERFPLFKDAASQKGRVKCLVIQGDSREFTAQFDGDARVEKDYRPLKGSDGEVAWLKDFLGSRPSENLEVKVIRYADPRDEQTAFVDVIRAELASNQYGLVHYSGHSEFFEQVNQGFLVLGGKSRDVFAVDAFAQWAQAAQFVFLCSCESADSRFVMRLVEAGIPAVAGYAWKIKDSIAREFCQQFYGVLFGDTRDRRYLEYSFMRAKDALRLAHPKESHWVAPMLYMQVFEPECAGSFA